MEDLHAYDYLNRYQLDFTQQQLETHLLNCSQPSQFYLEVQKAVEVAKKILGLNTLSSDKPKLWRDRQKEIHALEQCLLTTKKEAATLGKILFPNQNVLIYNDSSLHELCSDIDNSAETPLWFGIRYNDFWDNGNSIITTIHSLLNDIKPKNVTAFLNNPYLLKLQRMKALNGSNGNIFDPEQSKTIQGQAILIQTLETQLVESRDVQAKLLSKIETLEESLAKQSAVFESRFQSLQAEFSFLRNVNEKLKKDLEETKPKAAAWDRRLGSGHNQSYFFTPLSETEKQMRKAITNLEHPDEFICPITQTIMVEPVVAADGESYEKSAIMQWFTTCKASSTPITSPKHGKKMDEGLITNRALEKCIAIYTERAKSPRMNVDLPPNEEHEHTEELATKATTKVTTTPSQTL